MSNRTPEELLLRMLHELQDEMDPSYLILRAEPIRIVLVFPSGRPSPRYVFKCARHRASRAALEKEQRILTDLRARGSTGFRDTLPRPIARSEQSGLVGYLSGALPGARMKDLAPDRLFGSSIARATLRSITDWLVEFYEATGTAAGGWAAPGRDELFTAPAEKYLNWFRVSEDERALIRECLEGLPGPGTVDLPICRGHGDLSPANVLWDDGRIGVIDFEYALESCTPLDDLFHFLASMKSSTTVRERDAERRAYFEETFYGSGHLSAAARDAVHGLAGRMGVEVEHVERLFVLAWVRYAVRGVELQIRDLGLHELADDPERLWQRLDGEPGEFLPVLRIRGGVCGNVRQHLEMRDRFAL